MTRALARDPIQPRGTAAAAILGGLSPDVDFVLMPFGWDIYLRAHEVGTHSLPGVVITGLGSAALVRLLVRNGRFDVLAPTAVIAAVSHLLADVASGARLHPGWPLVDGITSLPLVAMADPGPILILLAGAIAMAVSPLRRRSTASITVAAFMAFLTLKFALFSVALHRAERNDDFARGQDRVVEARWASLTEWHVFDRVDSTLRQWRITLLAPEPRIEFTVQRRAETALERASRDLSTVRNFTAVHRLGFAVERDEPDGRRSVFWSDIRFCGRPSADAEPACGLWFGGLYDADGRVITQQVRVGSWVQDRPPDRAP